MNEKDKNKLIQKSNEAWRKLSTWWDKNIEDGDEFHRHLIFPGMIELVHCQPGMKILDLACGNGTLSRRFAALGASVLGVDVSEHFIRQAKARSSDAIRYDVLDATAEKELLALAAREQFDTIICSMALHDLPTLTPLMHALPSLMSPKGAFVFSIPHPCFNMGELKLDFSSEEPSVSRSRYINAMHLEMKSKPGQPIDQHCFHRALQDIFSRFFAIGMVLDGLKEPSMSHVEADLNQIACDWKRLPEIPPALICRWIFK